MISSGEYSAYMMNFMPSYTRFSSVVSTGAKTRVLSQNVTRLRSPVIDFSYPLCVLQLKGMAPLNLEARAGVPGRHMMLNCHNHRFVY